MSKALYQFGGLRFWSEDEINLREHFQSLVVQDISKTLLNANKAFRVFRIEGPCLSPRSEISESYDEDDVFMTNHVVGGDNLFLRAETTPSSYTFARQVQGKLPICIWQSGKSFRRETNDGASASKMRFNEFYQLEFQCIYKKDTKADYRQSILRNLVPLIQWFTASECRVVMSDRLPEYSLSTIDIEVKFKGKWIEVASCSIRADYSDDEYVCEIAIGLDRVVTIASYYKDIQMFDDSLLLQG